MRQCQRVKAAQQVKCGQRHDMRIVLKSLGGSAMALLPNCHCAVAGAEGGVPGDADSILHALVCGTALDVHGRFGTRHNLSSVPRRP